jgi:threonine/homoserine/homoserine lactone efflux protein
LFTFDIIQLVGLGFAVGAAFGPVNVLLTRLSLKRGAAAAYAFAAGAFIGDMLVLVFSLLGLSLALAALPSLGATLHVIGNTFLVAVAIRSLLMLFTNRRSEYASARSSYPSYFSAGVVITAASPFTWVLWQSVTSASIAAKEATPAYVIGVSAGVGDLIWFACWPHIPTWISRWASEKATLWMGAAADIIILMYGINGLFVTLKVLGN